VAAGNWRLAVRDKMMIVPINAAGGWLMAAGRLYFRPDWQSKMLITNNIRTVSATNAQKFWKELAGRAIFNRFISKQEI